MQPSSRQRVTSNASSQLLDRVSRVALPQGRNNSGVPYQGSSMLNLLIAAICISLLACAAPDVPQLGRPPQSESHFQSASPPRAWRPECWRLKPLQVLGSVTPPKLLSRVEPEWPSFGTTKPHGVVVLEAIIDSAGIVCDVRVGRSPFGEQGDPFDAAAASAIAKWTFGPASYENRPVAVIYAISVSVDP